MVEEYIENKLVAKINKEVAKASKRFGESFDEAQFNSTNPRVLGYQEKIKEVENRLKQVQEDEDMPGFKQLIEDLEKLPALFQEVKTGRMFDSST